ncbi:MAG: malate dehydrogenase (quinone) [Coraliomargarita sp.]
MTHQIETDVVLVGAGIMSATLAAMLKALDPELRITIFECLERAGLESSNAMNNAGTGHAGLCELNYCSEDADGAVDVSKTFKIFESFEQSKQLWAYLVEQGVLRNPEDFLKSVPHLSFVLEKNVGFLRKRFEKMHGHHFFEDMEMTEDWDEAAEWAPLLAEGRDRSEAFALTRVMDGTDVNFGGLTRSLIESIRGMRGVSANFGHSVTGLSRDGRGWQVKARDKRNGERIECSAKFVFLGAGGGALPLLQKSGIEESKGFGGFPVSGQWLVCNDPDIVAKHEAKIYGRAAVGAPPMSVPHLDTRYIDGKRCLLFGPFAGFSPKFLKSGSNLDLIKSVKANNLVPMLAVGKDNTDLTLYLIKQCLQSHEKRMEAVREFFPDAKSEDWRQATAGQRVQIIKKDAEKVGSLQFGTEVVSSADGSIAALLGASPGASTAVSVMLEVLERCFGARMASAEWQERLREIVPSYTLDLANDPQRYREIRAKVDRRLGLASGKRGEDDEQGRHSPRPSDGAPRPIATA